MAKVEVIKSEKADKPNYVWSILIFVGLFLVFYFGSGIFSGSFGDGGSCDTAQCRKAARYALTDIPELAIVFDTVKSSELECNAVSTTDDDIVLVKCTTTHSEIIDYYGSSTIWYGWISSADGLSYFRYADANKDTVLEKLRD